MKRLILGLWFLSTIMLAHTITKDYTNDSIHYEFLGYCSGGQKTFQGNYTPSISSANVCSNGCVQGKTKWEVINKICRSRNNKSSKQSKNYANKTQVKNIINHYYSDRNNLVSKKHIKIYSIFNLIGKNYKNTVFKNQKFMTSYKNIKYRQCKINGAPITILINGDTIVKIDMYYLQKSKFDKTLKIISNKYSNKHMKLENITVSGISVTHKTWKIKHSKKCKNSQLVFKASENIEWDFNKLITVHLEAECSDKL